MTDTAVREHEPTDERPRTDWLKPYMLVAVVVALVLRLVDLGSRPMHHDESLDAWFSWLFLNGNYEGYDPIFHGPLRFYVTAGFYTLFGESEASARLLPALAGTVLVGLPYLLRRQLGSVAVAATAAFLALSPTFLYFSRFAREDATMAFLTLALIIAVFAYLREPRPWLPTVILLVLVASLSIKETTFITIFVFGSFLLAALAQQLWSAGRDRDWQWLALLGLAPMLAAFGLGEPIFLNLGWYGVLLVGAVVVTAVNADRRGVSWTDVPILRAVAGVGWRPWLIAAGLALFAYAVIFTVFFTNWSGSDTPSTPWNALIDGVRGGFEYWRSQQEVNRGGEPWNYYLFVLPAYEWLAVALGAIGAYRVIRRPSLLGNFLIWAAVATTAAYSWASERFPWLVLHPLLPITLLAGLGVAELWDRRRGRFMPIVGGVLAAAAIVTVISSIDASYFRNVDPRQLLVQVQTTEEAVDVTERIQALDELSRDVRGEPVVVAIDNEDAWPWAWYLRDYENLLWFSTESGVPTDSDPDIVIFPTGNLPDYEADLDGYEEDVFPLRAWWVPHPYKDGGVGGWLNYLATRGVWNEGEGSLDEYLYIRPDLIELEQQAAQR